MANAPLKPEIGIDRTSTDFGRQVNENLQYLNTSMDYHQVLLDTAAEVTDGSFVTPNSLVRINGAGTGIESAINPPPFCDGGFRFARQMNYHNYAQLQTDTRPNRADRFVFGQVNQTPKVCLQSGTTSTAARLDFPSAPRRLGMSAFIAFRITANSTQNWDIIIGDEPRDYTSASVRSTGTFVRLTRNNGVLSWTNNNKGLSFNMVTDRTFIGGNTTVSGFRAIHDGVFFLRVNLATRDTAELPAAADPTRLFASLARYPVGDLDSAIALLEGYNRVSGIDALRGTTFLGAGWRGTSTNELDFETRAGYRASANNQRCLTIQNLSGQPFELFNVNITHGARNNVNIAGL